MMYSLFAKVIPSFFSPVMLSGIFAILGLIFFLRAKRVKGFLSVFLSVLILWFFACPVVSHILVRSLEGKYDQLEQYPPADAVILLGGGRFGARAYYGSKILKEEYAPFITVSGARIPLIYRSSNDISDDIPTPMEWIGSGLEGNQLLLSEFLGVDTNKIILIQDATNTFEEAVLLREEWDRRGLPKNIILVTSAIHMERSVRVFEKQGFNVVPAPTDFLIKANRNFNFYSFIPQAEYLLNSTLALREYLGLFSYEIMGRI